MIARGEANKPMARKVISMTAVSVLVIAAVWVGVSVRHDDAAAPGAAAERPHRTETEAVSAARAAGRPVEVTGMRAANRDVFANPDGTYTQNSYEQPVRMVRAGKWTPTDATLVRAADGSVGPRAALAGLRLSGGGTGPFATVERAGRRYTLMWPGRLPAPRLEGSKATYSEVWPGVDLVATATVTGFSHVIVVKTAVAARSASLHRITLGIRTSMLRVTTAPGGGLSMVDAASGGLVFQTPVPRMWDSAGAAGQDPAVSAPDGARVARLGVRLAKGALTLIPDAGMVAGAATRYPLYLDPFTAASSNESYAMVDSGYPSEEYWKFDGKDNERIGKCPPNSSPCFDSDVKRLFYVLPTGYAGKTIINAAFRVTMTQSWDNTARGVSLYRAGGNGALITSATNWNNMPGGQAMSGFVKQDSSSPTGSIACQSGSVRNTEFDAAEAVRKNFSKTTFLLRADNESDYRYSKRFCHNAILSVTYNRAPNQPAISQLSMSPGGACVNGASRPYVSSLPKLKAVLTDPDNADAEPLKAEFKVTWTPTGGTAQTKSWTSLALGNGSTFTYDLAASGTGVPALPENVITHWQVRAYDDTAYGAWSSPLCEFVLDKTKPAGPDVDSPQYLPADASDTTPNCVDDATWWPGVGRYGSFTFDSSAPDVHTYQYGFDTNPSPAHTLTPAVDGGPVAVRWLPDTEGPHTINVVAVDRAGKQSDISSCTFRVAAGSGPVADWRLDDPAGSTTAADASGNHPAVAGPAVQFGAPGPGGAADGAVHLIGAPGSYLAPTDGTTADTSQGLTVSAWVRLTDDTRYQILLSQDGTGESAFQIGYNPGNHRWFVLTPITDVESLGNWSVNGPVAVKDTWTHLAVVLDPVAQTMSVAVDGGTATTAARRFAWTAHGALQIGRRFIHTGLYGDAFAGDVADVRVYDRLLTTAEVSALPQQVTTRRAYWDLDGMTSVDGQAPLIGRSAGYGTSVELEPDLELGVYTGARHYRLLSPDEPGYDPFAPQPLVGDGQLVLDGATGYAATAGPVAATDKSFSVAVRAQPATDCTTRAMSVLSQAGVHASGFDLGCVPDGADAHWRVVLPGSDANNAAATEIVGAGVRPDPNAASGQFLTVTYDAAYQKLTLYVDGQDVGEATGVTDTWAAGGALQIGRSIADSTWGRPFGGVVDEVRVYSGVLDPDTVQQLNSLTAVPDL
jgi:hypothetical protein